MALPRIWPAAAFVAAACGPGAEHEPLPPLPAAIEWVAAVARTPDGAIHASALAAVGTADPPRLALDLPADPDDLWVIGYAGERAASAAGGARLAVAEHCAPALPEPSFSAAIRGSGEPLRLASAALDASCAPIVDRLRVQSACWGTWCARAARQTGCALTFDLEGCGLGVIEARLDLDRQLCLDPGPSARGCEPIGGALDTGGAALRCPFSGPKGPTSCDVELLLEPTSPRFSVERLTVRSVAPALPTDEGRPRERLRRIVASLGPLADFLVTSGGYVAVVRTSPLESFANGEPASTELVWLDRSGEVTRTARGPIGLTLVEPDPRSAGFIGVFQDQRRFWAGRFDQDGGLVAAQPIAPWSGIASESPLVPDLAYSAALDAWVLVLRMRKAEPDVLLLLDPDHLHPIRRRGLGAITTGHVGVDGDRVLISDDDGDQLVWLDPRQEGIAEAFDLFGETSAPVMNGFLVLGDRRYLVAQGGTGAGVVRIEAGPAAQGTRHGLLALASEPVDLLRVPWSDREILVTIVSGSGAGSRAIAAPFDAVVGRFLPGQIELGFAIAGRARADGDALVIALPFSAELVRIAERRD